uniref:YadA C-terminal domain-containing protein n=1 Tax=Aliivibrio fischeri TaxID=668 RepID=UPI000A5E9F43
EEAIQYIVDGNVQVKNAKNLDKAVKFRMNNEDKYEFTAEQKVAAVNKLTGNDRLEVHTTAGGTKQLMDKSTGQVYTADQVATMAKEARAQIIAEAQKRSEEITPPEGELPPIRTPIEDAPVIEPNNEQIKEAVQNLASHGYSSQANIDTNAANIDELFNITADLREDLELQGARNMAAISARAFTTEEGEFSVGVGLGGSGSENAMAIGGAYQINANWSVNTTIAFDTGSNADYGVGAHYSW